jgi:hypothetical protein
MKAITFTFIPLLNPKQGIITSYFLTEQVLIPTMEYSGQKLTKLVNAKIMANTPKTSASVPLMVPVK